MEMSHTLYKYKKPSRVRSRLSPVVLCFFLLHRTVRSLFLGKVSKISSSIDREAVYVGVDPLLLFQSTHDQ